MVRDLAPILFAALAAAVSDRLTLRARLGEAALRVMGKTFGRTLRRPVARLYHYDLIFSTDNFDTLSWAGVPIWQNPLDLWTMQETISEIRPELLIETGTHRGGRRGSTRTSWTYSARGGS